MIKLVCDKCAKIWYTSNTSIDQECDDCGARLVEVDFIAAKEIETETETGSTMKFSDNDLLISNCSISKQWGRK